MGNDKWLVVAMASTWLFAGAVEPHLPNAGQPVNEVAVAHTVVLALMLFAWCKAHAVTHRVVPPTAAPLLVGIIPPVGIPYYFFRGFGWRKGLLLTLLAIGTLILFFVLYFVAFTLSARVGT